MVYLLLPLFAFTGLNAISATAKEELIHEVKFSADDLFFGILNGYDTVILPNCIATIEPGKPQLPLKVLHFAIDQDKEVSGIEIIADTNEEIQGKYNIYPAQKPTRMDEKIEFTPPNLSIYNSSESYPESRVEIKAKGSLSGTKIVTVHLYPLEYIPAKKKLILHTTMRFKVVQKNKSSPRANIQTEATTAIQSVGKNSGMENDTIKSMLKKVIANPKYVGEQLKEPYRLQSINNEIFNSRNGGITDYLIITSESLENSGVFQPLLDSKIARGLSVAIESVEDIETGYSGRDTAEKIRNFIKETWINDGLVWVLLGGDTNIVPVRIAKVLEEDIPCDMYYSDLDGDWDDNGNSIFGELDDAVDMYPDVFVGRAPVENEQEAQVFVNKVLTYENNIQYYANKALFLGQEDFYDVGERTKEFIDAEYMPAQFKPITKYYERYIPEYRQLTLEAINQGYHLINHIDHASTDWLATGGDVISINDIDNLTNASALSIIWSCGCWPAAIDYDCVAEHWINNPSGGGVAFIGNSRNGLNPWSTEYLDKEFYKSLFIDSFTHIGQTLANSKIIFIGQAQSEAGSALRYCMFELNLLGDPEMNIITNMGLLPNISAPSMNTFIQGATEIQGSVISDEMSFSRYELYYSPTDDAEDTTLIVSSITPVENGLLGVWNTDIVECPDGEYILTLKVIDINGMEFTCSVSVTIDNYNQPPEFVNLTNKGAVIDRLLEFKVETQDPDNPETPWGNLIHSASNLPQGAAFNPETQMFSWSPTEENKGTYEVTFTVRDNKYTITQNIIVITVVIEETPICADPDDQFFPSIYSDKIVWTDYRNGDKDIYMYDLSTNQETQITTGGTAQSPAVYTDKIVWDDYRDMKNDIYMYNLSTSQQTQITTSGDAQFPSIYGDKIVWTDYRNGNSDIYMYDLSTGQETLIWVATGQQYEQSVVMPTIYGDKIVWSFSAEIAELFPYIFNSTIYMHDITTSQENQVTTHYWLMFNPEIYGNKIIWRDYRNGDWNIYMHDLSTQEEIPICTVLSNQSSPSIYEDKIVWADYRNGNWDIYMYDVSMNMDIQITNNAQKQSSSDIYGNKIVWQDKRNGNSDIYMAKLIYSPYLITINPNIILPGGTLTLTGENFGDSQEDSIVSFENGVVCSIQDWSDTEIVCTVPEDALLKVINQVRVINKAGPSNGLVILINLFQNESNSDGSGCFIATACYGVPMADEVKVLSRFRNEYLLTNPVGKTFVKTYYKISPTIADFIKNHPVLKIMTREFLKPLIWLTKRANRGKDV